MGKTKCMKLINLKSALKCDSFDVAIGIEMSLLTTVRYHELFDSDEESTLALA